jgi:hypothetical protein
VAAMPAGSSGCGCHCCGAVWGSRGRGGRTDTNSFDEGEEKFWRETERGSRGELEGDVAVSVRREGDDVASRRLHFSLMAPVHFFVTARDFQEQLCVLLIFG